MSVREPKDRLDPGRGSWERLDASRREMVQLCGEKGKVLFLFLLESSTIIPEREDVAVFPLQRLDDVARQLGWSADTVKRYVAVFRTMNLVQHYHDRRQEVKLYLPLGSYTPLTNFIALDELTGKRKKLQQLAQKVKTRYLTRFGDPTQSHSDEIRTTFEDLKAILDNEHLEPLKRQRLQIKIANLLTQVAGKAEHSSMGDLNNLLDDSAAALAKQGLGIPPQQGDSDRRRGAPCHTNTSNQKDEAAERGDPNCSQGDLKRQQGEFLRQSPPRLPVTPQPQGDLKRGQGEFLQQSPPRPPVTPQPQGDSNRPQGEFLRQPPPKPPLTPQPQGDSNRPQGEFLRQPPPKPPLTPQAQANLKRGQGDFFERYREFLGQHPLTPLPTSQSQGDLGSTISSVSAHPSGQQGDPKRGQGDFLGQFPLRPPLTPQPQKDPKRQKEECLERYRDFFEKHPPMPAHTLPLQGDLKCGQGDFLPPSPTESLLKGEQQGDPNRPQGDSLLPSQAQQSLETDTLGDSKAPPVLEQGDSNQQTAQSVDVVAPYTYNVLYLIKNSNNTNTLIRKRLAQFLAKVLEEKEIDNGYPTFSKYLKAFKVYTPGVIGRAFLATLFLLYHEHWEVNPGATFTNQCKVLSGQMPLAHYTLDDVEGWLQAWGNLSYPELLIAIAAPSSTKQVPEPAELITSPRLPTATTTRDLSGQFGANGRKKRVYGLQYTGREMSNNRDVHTLGSPRPPTDQKS